MFIVAFAAHRFLFAAGFVRAQEPLSAAAQARLAVLPDLSFMLSDRLRFPMRAVVLSAPIGVE